MEKKKTIWGIPIVTLVIALSGILTVVGMGVLYFQTSMVPHTVEVFGGEGEVFPLDWVDFHDGVVATALTPTDGVQALVLSLEGFSTDGDLALAIDIAGLDGINVNVNLAWTSINTYDSGLNTIFFLDESEVSTIVFSNAIWYPIDETSYLDVSSAVNGEIILTQAEMSRSIYASPVEVLDGLFENCNSLTLLMTFDTGSASYGTYFPEITISVGSAT